MIFKINDKIGACMDMNAKTIEFYYNGTNLGIAYSNIDTNVSYSPAITFYNLADDIDYFPSAKEPQLGTSSVGMPIGGDAGGTLKGTPLVNSIVPNFTFHQAPGISLLNGNLTAKYGEYTSNQIRTVFSKNSWTSGTHYW